MDEPQRKMTWDEIASELTALREENKKLAKENKRLLKENIQLLEDLEEANAALRKWDF